MAVQPNERKADPIYFLSDHLRSVPDRLEALMSEKRFLSAVILLVRSMKMINKTDMMEIGALSDLRAWMIQQEGVSQLLLLV